MTPKQLMIYMFLKEVSWTTKTRVPAMFDTFFEHSHDEEISSLSFVLSPTEEQVERMHMLLAQGMGDKNLREILDKLTFWAVPLIIDFFRDTRLMTLTSTAKRYLDIDPREHSKKQRAYLTDELVEFLNSK